MAYLPPNLYLCLEHVSGRYAHFSSHLSAGWRTSANRSRRTCGSTSTRARAEKDTSWHRIRARPQSCRNAPDRTGFMQCVKTSVPTVASSSAAPAARRQKSQASAWRPRDPPIWPLGPAAQPALVPQILKPLRQRFAQSRLRRLIQLPPTGCQIENVDHRIAFRIDQRHFDVAPAGSEAQCDLPQ